MSVESIQAALAAHAESSASGESSMDSLGNTPDPVVNEPVVEESAAGSEGVVVAAEGTENPDPAKTQEQAEKDELDKLLEAEGILPVSSRGENRIPYSRVKATQKNFQTRWDKEVAAPLRTQVEQLTQSNQNYQNAERLAQADPDRYIAALAAADPRYAKFLSPQSAASAKAEVKDVADDPEPQPTTDKDGNTFFTPEGWKEHQAWSRRQAVREATQAVEAKYGKTLGNLTARERAAADYAARKPAVDRQIKAVNDAWGAELVSKHEADIIKVMQDGEARGEIITLAEAAATVLLPLTRQDEAAIRAKVVAELNKRPAAASTTVVQSHRKNDAGNDGEPLTGADIIRRELDRVAPNRNR